MLQQRPSCCPWPTVPSRRGRWYEWFPSGGWVWSWSLNDGHSTQLQFANIPLVHTLDNSKVLFVIPFPIPSISSIILIYSFFSSYFCSSGAYFIIINAGKYLYFFIRIGLCISIIKPVEKGFYLSIINNPIPISLFSCLPTSF